MKQDDFPKDRYPKKDTSGKPPLELLQYIDEEDIPATGKEQYMLLSKIQKRKRFEMIKDFRYIGLNQVPINLGKLEELEAKQAAEEEAKWRAEEDEGPGQQTRKTKGIHKYQLQPPMFRTKAAEYLDLRRSPAKRNEGFEVVVQRKKHHQMGLIEEINEIHIDPII